MRASLALCLFACMLSLSGLTGCSLTKKSRTGSGGTSQPFVGAPSESTPPAEEENKGNFVSKQADRPGKGILAGEVKDVHGRGVGDAAITVVEDPPVKEAAAPLTATTERGGYFYLSGLDVGRSYRLSAKKRDGNRFLVGTVKVKSSNTHVLIPLTGEEPAGAVERADERTGGKDEKTNSPASLLAPHHGDRGDDVPPVRTETAPPSVPMPTPDDVQPRQKEEARPPEPKQDAPPRPRPLDTPVPQLPTPDPSLIGKGGFRQGPPAVSIPGQGQEKKNKPMTPGVLPPAPMTDGGLKPSTAPSALADPDERPIPTQESKLSKEVVPSCVHDGRRVVDFALYDYDGNVWQLKKKSRGKLVLLAFWHSKCVPCKHAIPYLNRLNSYYREYGLDVVSVAHESGTPVEKQDAVRSARTKINYPILFTGGGKGDCPVMRQFEIQGYPTVLVLDGGGRILWRSNGLNPRTEYDLEMFLRKQLGIR